MAGSVLDRLRAICLALPETTETETWGHPNFRVANKIFCAYETYQGELSACFKVGKQMQGVYLQDARFYMTPYVGRHGWVSLKINAAKINWKEVEGLVHMSYRLIAPAKVRNME
ncbi:MAG: MmcQ/YjbR family DNA-binding protein [Acidobacteria bacterium]|nr:MmcQ/YjbR family DNA-binding protein [Acidobacteriota bacterium]